MTPHPSGRWFRTGDLGVIDAEGYVTITGRLKDVIIRKGENISAKEIEDVLFTHPKVADVAVIGLPDPASGERACAVVVCAEGEPLTFLEMTEHLKAADLAPQKIPEQLELLDVAAAQRRAARCSSATCAPSTAARSRMSRLPVIIGVGQHTHRGADDAPEAEPLRLIEAACRAASADSGADLLGAVGAITVMRVGSWRYDDLPAAGGRRDRRRPPPARGARPHRSAATRRCARSTPRPPASRPAKRVSRSSQVRRRRAWRPTTASGG